MDSAVPAGRTQTASRTILHPAAGALILGVDWLFFGSDLLSLGLTTLASSVAAFAVTAGGVYWVQRARTGDTPAKAALKAAFGGVVAGIPTSIAGTVVGTAILVMAGLRGWLSKPGAKEKTRAAARGCTPGGRPRS